MIVKESIDFNLGKKPLTIIRMDEPRPLTDWRKVVVGNKEYEPVFHSGLDEFSVCLNGSLNLVGKEIMFI